MDHIYIENNQVIYNKKAPFFIHAAGGRSHLDNVIQRLGYKLNENIKKQLEEVYYKKFLYYFKMNIIYILLFIIIVIVIIYILYKVIMHKKYIKLYKKLFS